MAKILKRFTVSNFKNFEGDCTIDFTKIRDYNFNTNLIKENKYVNKVLLYGKNGSGKSNLGFALMDISNHLSRNQKNLMYYLNNLNGSSAVPYISFVYDFDFDGDDVIYSYKKDENLSLIEETIVQNGKKVFEYDYRTNLFSNQLEELKDFNKDLLRNRNINNSVIKMIYGYSTNLPKNSPIKNLFEFADGMLWFRSVLEGFSFMGNTEKVESIETFLIEEAPDALLQFQEFLKNNGLPYKLSIGNYGQNTRVMANFQNKVMPLFDIASTGTKSLWLFYYWMHRCNGHITFLFLDEFDAFYHPSLSKAVLEMVLEKDSFQSIVTTHNTYLADNSIMRPDCYWIIKDGEVKSFADRTNKVIREGNNLEKMMLGDEFQ